MLSLSFPLFPFWLFSSFLSPFFIPLPLSAFLSLLSLSSTVVRIFPILCTTMCKVCFFCCCCYYYLVGNLDYIQEKGYTSFKHERTIDPKQVYEQNKQVRPFLKRVNTCFPEEWIHWPLKILVSRQYCQPFILFSQSSLKCSVHLCSATVAAQFPTFLLKYPFIFV